LHSPRRADGPRRGGRRRLHPGVTAGRRFAGPDRTPDRSAPAAHHAPRFRLSSIPRPAIARPPPLWRPEAETTPRPAASRAREPGSSPWRTPPKVILRRARWTPREPALSAVYRTLFTALLASLFPDSSTFSTGFFSGTTTCFSGATVPRAGL